MRQVRIQKLLRVLQQYRHQKIFQEIFEKIDGREAKLTGKLSDSYILGYYHQKESFYQKQEEDAEKPEAIAI